jgi:hypothetical protein
MYQLIILTMEETMESTKPEKTKKQLDAAKRFKKFYDTKIKDKDKKRECECGCVVGYMSLSRHRKSPKHARIMKEKELKSEATV